MNAKTKQKIIFDNTQRTKSTWHGYIYYFRASKFQLKAHSLKKVLLFFCITNALLIRAQENEKSVLFSRWHDTSVKEDSRCKALDELLESYYAFSNTDSAILLTKEGLILAKEHNLRNWEAEFSNWLGIIYGIQGKYDEALTEHYNALHIFNLDRDLKGVSRVLNAISIIFYNRSEYERSLTYLKQSTAIRKYTKDTLGLASNFNNLGNLWLDGFRDTLEAKRYFKLSFDLCVTNKDKRGEGIAAYNLGRIFFDQNKLSLAQHYLKIAELRMNEERNDVMMVRIKSMFSRLHFHQGNMQKTLSYAEDAYKLGREINAMHSLWNITYDLHVLFKDQKQYEKSLNYLEEYVEIKNELFSAEMEEAIFKTTLKYEFEKKMFEDSITYANELEQKEVIIRSEKRDKIYLIAILIILLALLYISYSLFKSNKEKRLLVEDENERLSKEIQEIVSKTEIVQTEKNHENTWDLTPRQLEILELIKSGMTNKEIAAKLFISVNTVKYHLKAIYEVLNIEHRTNVKHFNT